MGNEQSSQAVPEVEPQDSNANKPWSPEDITDTDDEADTIVAKTTTGDVEPKKSPNKSPKARSKKRKKKTSRSSPVLNNVQSSGEREVDDEDLEKAGSQPITLDALDAQEEADGTVEDEITYPMLSNSDTPEESLDKSSPKQLRSASSTNEARHNSKPLQLRSKVVQQRYPCPEAEQNDCDKTFASERSARRHAQHHSLVEFRCPVCEKTYSRADRLKTHQMIHSGIEIAEAVAQAEKQLEQEQEQEQEHGQGERHLEDDEQEQESENETAEEDPHELSNLTEEVPDVHRPHHLSSNLDETLSAIPDSTFAQTPLQHISNGLNVDQSSAQVSTTSASVFDEPVDAERIQETPRPKTRLKRKRDTLILTESADSQDTTSRKRRRRHSLSPPTSPNSEQERIGRIDKVPTENTDLITTRIPRIQKANSFKTGNLDDFAKPYVPGSQLHHPIHNPRSPRKERKQVVQVIIPQSSQAGSSSQAFVNGETKSSAATRNTLHPKRASEVHPLKPVVFTSPKGKRRAEDGVVYSSPPTARNGNDDESSDAFEPEGMATSIAKKTMNGRKPQKRAREDDSDIEAQSEPDSSYGKGSNVKSGSAPLFVCQECSRRFETRQALRKHESRPNVHSRDHECEDCGKFFPSSEGLQLHQRKTNHGDGTGYQGRKGFFDTDEVKKLKSWRNRFCNEHDIDVPTFNQIMTDTCRRTKGFHWPYRYIAKAEFLQEYYDVLPDRNQRSMRRYRERAFQNVPERQEWTPEDDEELIQLVKELGQKWVEIGQRMTRTQDSVSQRWRFKLQYKGKANQGEWLQKEEEKLKDMVAQVKRESGIAMDPHVDVRFPWESVSKKMKGTRTAQQCSNKWRLLHLKRKGNKFIKPSGSDKSRASPSTTQTPSRMSQRLSGTTPSTLRPGSSSRKKVVSDYRVHESDGDSDVGSEASDSAEKRSASDKQQRRSHSSRQPDTADEQSDGQLSGSKRNALNARTPQNSRGLSQLFAQTQANTSALRAPDTMRKESTPTEMPTPGIPIQPRPTSASWNAINSPDALRRNDSSQSTEIDKDNEMEGISGNKLDGQVQDEEESTSSESDNDVDEETSPSESPNDSNEVSQTDEVVDETDAETENDGPESGSTDSDDNEDDDNDTDMKDTKMEDVDKFKESFMQSIPRFSQKSANRSGAIKYGSQWNRGRLMRGSEKDDSSTQDSAESDIEDEGDIEFTQHSVDQ